MCGRDRKIRSQGFDQRKDDGGSESIFFCRSANAAGAKDRFVSGNRDEAGQLSRPEINLPFLEIDFQDSDAQVGAGLVDFS